MQESPDTGSGQAAGRAVKLSLQHNFCDQVLSAVQSLYCSWWHAVVAQGQSEVTAVVTQDRRMHPVAESAVLSFHACFAFTNEPCMPACLQQLLRYVTYIAFC